MRLDHLLSKEESRGCEYCLVFNQEEEKKFLVSMRLRETPVHIPNTTVKPLTADGTILETIWESRWMPNFIKDDFYSHQRI